MYFLEGDSVRSVLATRLRNRTGIALMLLVSFTLTPMLAARMSPPPPVQAPGTAVLVDRLTAELHEHREGDPITHDDLLDFHDLRRPECMSFWMIMVLCFCYGFVPARKPGKLPSRTFRADGQSYSYVEGLTAKVDVREVAHLEQLGTWSDPERVPGEWQLATDWAPYAQHMLDVLNAAPEFRNVAADGRYVPRPSTRLKTRFEARDVAAVLRRAHTADVDLILLDPPYDRDNLGDVLDAAAITRAPMALAIWIAAVPTPPAAPSTSTVSPAFSCARSTSAWCEVA